MIRRITLIILLSGFVFLVKGQTEYKFKEGLAADSVHKYGREALVMDLLTHAMYTGKFVKPVPQQRILPQSQYTHVWQSLTADSTGHFKSNALRNGYLYLTYKSVQAGTALLHVQGHNMLFVNGQPHAGDVYRQGWLYIPVSLKKGDNEILIRCSSWAAWQGITATLVFPEKKLLIHTEDMTLPTIVLDNTSQPLWAGIVIINTTNRALTNLSITSLLEGKEHKTKLPLIGPLTIRKIGFQINASTVVHSGSYTCKVVLTQNGKTEDEKSISLEAVNPDEYYSNTFVSNIDGSIQYYGVTPRHPSATVNKPALFFSVHGAGVEAIGQARAYARKDWGVLVAPTNRRPRGFNWEDWGRIDALEVLKLAEIKFSPDPDRIYLTGHSMGGHGTWYLGATYPDKWAAIAPCAGYPTLIGYGSADGKIPVTAKTNYEKVLNRASNGSNVLELMKNYQRLGIYIHHGDSDKVVSVNYARQMRQLLASFHKDFSYYEYPGGSHWFGEASVDWKPLFDYFKWHTIAQDSAVNRIEFITANPGISSQYKWAAIQQQTKSLEYSWINIERNKIDKSIRGTTENVSILRLQLNEFDKGDTITITLDKSKPFRYIKTLADTVYLYNLKQWSAGIKPDSEKKGANRNGTFKEPFDHHMVFVYSTKGDNSENEWSYSKARYDAETWYYKGNGAVDVIADRNFNPETYRQRGIVLYGNASTNSAWDKLLKNCPIRITRGNAVVGSKKYEGTNIGAYFTWPREDSDFASIAVISGTGLPGMQATEPNQYFSGGSGFPDYLILSTEMLKSGAAGIINAGFFDNDWQIHTDD